MLLLRSFTKAVSGVVCEKAVTVLSVIPVKDNLFNMFTQACGEFVIGQFLFFYKTYFSLNKI